MGATYSALVFQPPPQPSYKQADLEGFFWITEGGKISFFSLHFFETFLQSFCNNKSARFLRYGWNIVKTKQIHRPQIRVTLRCCTPPVR